MAVIGRKKRAVARGWEAINKQRDEESKRLLGETEKKEKVTSEEHEARVKMLKDLGLIR